jgi:hypothetical protein
VPRIPDPSVAGSQIRGPVLRHRLQGSATRTRNLADLAQASWFSYAPLRPMAIASVAVELGSVHHCQSEIPDDSPPTRTPPRPSRYGERHDVGGRATAERPICCCLHDMDPFREQSLNLEAVAGSLVSVLRLVILCCRLHQAFGRCLP